MHDYLSCQKFAQEPWDSCTQNSRAKMNIKIPANRQHSMCKDGQIHLTRLLLTYAFATPGYPQSQYGTHNSLVRFQNSIKL